MKNVMRQQIWAIFTDRSYMSLNGLWMSGYDEGEYKQWLPNGKVWRHCFYKGNNLIGEYKEFYGSDETNIIPAKHAFYPKGGPTDMGFKLTAENIDKIKKKYPKGPWLKD